MGVIKFHERKSSSFLGCSRASKVASSWADCRGLMSKFYDASDDDLRPNVLQPTAPLGRVVSRKLLLSSSSPRCRGDAFLLSCTFHLQRLIFFLYAIYFVLVFRFISLSLSRSSKHWASRVVVVTRESYKRDLPPAWT